MDPPGIRERRRAVRIKLDWPVYVWSEATNRFYRGKSVNISSTGVLIKLPLQIPIRLEDRISVSFPAPQESETSPLGSEEHVFKGRVVRINRGSSILEGYQSVALEFEG